MTMRSKQCPICNFTFTYDDFQGEHIHCGDTSCAAVYSGGVATASTIDEDEGDEQWQLPAQLVSDSDTDLDDDDDAQSDELDENPVIAEYERYRQGVVNAAKTTSGNPRISTPTAGPKTLAGATGFSKSATYAGWGNYTGSAGYTTGSVGPKKSDTVSSDTKHEHKWVWSGNPNGMTFCSICDVDYNQNKHGDLKDLGQGGHN